MSNDINMFYNVILGMYILIQVVLILGLVIYFNIITKVIKVIK